MAVCGPVWGLLETKRLPVSVGEASVVKATFTITSSVAGSFKKGQQLNRETVK